LKEKAGLIRSSTWPLGDSRFTSPAWRS
jgi:hypothetical protein